LKIKTIKKIGEAIDKLLFVQLVQKWSLGAESPSGRISSGCGKLFSYPPFFESKMCAKCGYARSYPQCEQLYTTGVVYLDPCQVRMFVLVFVIKSQKQAKNELFFLTAPL